MKQRTGAIIGIVMALVLSTVVGGAVFLVQRWNSIAPLSASVPVVAIFTFVGLLMMTQTDGKHWQITESSLRAAIAGTVVITYLVVTGLVAFFTIYPKEMPPITQMMITNLTTIAGVVIASYFGASAYVQARSKDDDSKRTPGSTPLA
jgi:hypothetical protein